MQFFRDTNIQFMKYRRHWLVVSVALMALAIFAVFIQGKLNIGIDFAGGTQLTLKFQEPVEIDRLRDLLQGAGIDDAQIQSFGEPGDNEVLIKTPVLEGSQEGRREAIVAALDTAFPASGSGPDLNRIGAIDLTDYLLERDPEGLVALDEVAARDTYEAVADAVLAQRRELGLLSGADDLRGIEGVSDAVAQTIQSGTSTGAFSVLGAENVGPQIGSELRQKGIMAITMSLLGMLVYIWFRFELRFGMGALAAVVHDVLITLGLYALTGYEFNLTTVAAFLTLVGYSVNDSVVVFDRVRENIRRFRSRPLEGIMNLSINQMLSRTVLTSGTTLLAVGCLFFLGGDVLRGFSFILLIGVLVGTYSSIYIASPIALWWERTFGRSARTQRKEARTAAR